MLAALRPATILPVLWPLATAVVAAFGLVMTALYVRAGRSVTVPTIVHAIGGDLPLVVVLGLAFIQ